MRHMTIIPPRLSRPVAAGLLLLGLLASLSLVSGVARADTGSSGCDISNKYNICTSTMTAATSSAPIGATVKLTVQVRNNATPTPKGVNDVCVGVFAFRNGSVDNDATISGDQNTTDSDGFVSFDLTEASAGQDTYRAFTYGSTAQNPGGCSAGANDPQLVQTATVTWTPAGSEAVNSTVTATPTRVVADGHSTSTVTVVLTDGSGNAVIGAPVKLTATGSAVVRPASAVSGPGGQATFTVADRSAETVTLTASSGSTTIAQTATVTFYNTTNSEAADSTVTASLYRVEANGLASSTITVVAANANGPISGATINLTSSSANGAITPINGGVTNSAGQATFTVVDNTPERVTYTASDNTNGNTNLGSVTIRFGDAGSEEYDSAVSLSSGATNPTPTTTTSVPDDGTTAASVYVQLLCNDPVTYIGPTPITPDYDCNSSGNAQYTIVSGTDNTANPPTTTYLYHQGDPFGTVSGAQVKLVPTGSSSAQVTNILDPTNPDGQARFQVTDTKAESVTFDVIDVTNNVELMTNQNPQPQTVTINFTGAGSPSALTSTAVASPTSVPADGATASTITVTLKDSNGTPVPGREVSVTRNNGSATVSPANAITNSNGVATFATTDTKAETVSYVVQDVTDNLALVTFPTVNFTAGAASASASTLVASPTSVAADGKTTSTVTATLTDAAGNPLSGKTVTLAANTGTHSTISPTSGTTNASGNVSFKVTDATSEAVTYTASDTSASPAVVIAQTATVTFTGLPTATNSTVAASPTTVPANNLTASTVTVTLRDAGGFPVSGKTVALAAASGVSSINPSSPGSNVTSQSGQATFAVTDGTPQAVTYGATDQTDGIPITQTATVTFTGSPSGSMSSVTASPTTVAADGTTASTIAVKITDASGSPIPGQNISLTANGGNSTITAVNATTDATGTATFKVTDTKAETITYSATDTSTSPVQKLFQTAQVTFAPASESANSTVTASPASVLANGTATSTITVTLKNGNQQPLSGHSVTLSQGGGSSVIKTSPATTNASGVATFTVTDTNPETVTYTATDTTAATTLAQTAQVTFTAVPSEASLSTVTVSPATVPANGTSTSTVTVTLKGSSGAPLSKDVVALSTTGSATVSPATAITNTSGVATFTVSDTTVETVKVTATDQSTATVITQQPTITFTQPSNEATASTIAASPPTVPADGKTQSQIVVTLMANGKPLVGDNVVLSATNGISQITATTDPTGADGKAVFSVTDTTPETVTYTATDTTTGITLTGITQVGFSQVATTPTVTSVSPNTGSTRGGTQVTIQGTGFAGATAVYFGSTPITNVTVNSAGNTITVTSPAGRGTVNITVVTPNGKSATSSADQFTYSMGH